MKAMILAAGLGTRMKPITNVIPKPLIPVFGVPLIRYALENLKKAGVKEVIVNLHHLPDLLKQYLSTLKEFNISFSYEPTILGTGGGILKAKKFFGNKRFMIVNSDVIMNLDVRHALELHQKKKSIATMVVRKLTPQEHYDAVGINPTGKIVKFKTQDIRSPLIKTMFTGVHIFEPEIFDYFPKNKKIFCINNDVYAHMVQKNINVFGYLHKGFWNDIGTLDLYLKVSRDAQLRSKFLKFFPGIIFPKIAK